MKDLGEAKFCMGLRITRDREKGLIFLDQRRHIEDLLHKYNMADCNSTSVPADPNQTLSKSMCPDIDKEEMSRVPFQEAVGGLLYVSQGSRPDTQSIRLVDSTTIPANLIGKQ